MRKNFLVHTLVVSFVLQTWMGFAQSQKEETKAEKKSSAFKAKAQVEADILMSDLEWEHQQIRQDILNEFKENKIDLGAEYLDAEKKEFEAFKQEETKRLHQFALDLEKNSDDPKLSDNNALQAKIDSIVLETIEHSKQKAALDRKLKLKIESLQSKGNTALNYRLSANDVESIEPLLKLERASSIRLLQLRNELQLIRNLAREGFYFLNQEIRDKFILNHFGLPTLSLVITSFISIGVIIGYQMRTLSEARIPLYMVLAHGALLIAYVANKSIKMRKTFWNSNLPYKTRSFDSKIKESFEKTVQIQYESMTFDNFSEAAAVHALLQSASCSRILQLEQPKIPTASEAHVGEVKAPPVQIKAERKQRFLLPTRKLRVEQPKVRQEEFSSEAAADLEATQMQEHEKPDLKKILPNQ